MAARSPDDETQPPPLPESGVQLAVRRAKRLVKIVVAFTLILIAFAFGFIPGIPGWPLAFVGLAMLAAEYVWARRLLNRIRREGLRLKEALTPRRIRERRRRKTTE